MSFQRRKNESRFDRRSATSRALDLATDLKHVAGTYVNSPRVILAVIVVIALAATHSIDKADGFIHEWAKKYPTNAIVQYASKYFEKVVGMLAFLPVFLVVPRRSSPILTTIAVLVCILCLPPANFYQYMLLSLITHVFVSARIAATRVVALLSLLSYVVVLHETLKTVPHLPALLASNGFKAAVQNAQSRT